VTFPRGHCAHYRNGGTDEVPVLRLYCCKCTAWTHDVEGLTVLTMWADERRLRETLAHPALCTVASGCIRP
jgi:hypothetical protein